MTVHNAVIHNATDSFFILNCIRCIANSDSAKSTGNIINMTGQRCLSVWIFVEDDSALWVNGPSLCSLFMKVSSVKDSGVEESRVGFCNAAVMDMHLN